MPKELFANAPMIMGVGLVLFGLGGIITGDLELDAGVEKIVVGLGLLGFHVGATAKPKS